MSQKFGNYLSEYIQSRIGVFKKYMIAALNNKEQSIWYLESTEGLIIPSSDLKNCELLRDAQIFREDTRISRTGRNICKVFSLTDFGKQISEELKKESEIAAEPEGDSA